MGITKVTTAYIQFREAQKRNKQRNSKTTKKTREQFTRPKPTYLAAETAETRISKVI